MANIDKELNQIKNAVYGREVRGSIHDGIDKINKETEKTTNEQESLSDMFKQLIIDEGNSNAEVVASRGKEDWLPDRLNSFDSQLAETATETQLGRIMVDGRTIKSNSEGVISAKNNWYPVEVPEGWSWVDYPLKNKVFTDGLGNFKIMDFDVSTLQPVGKTYYVDVNNGDDNNDGTSLNKAFKNMTTALSREDAVVIMVAEGIYSRSSGFTNDDIITTKKTIKAIPGHNVLFTSTHPIVSWTKTEGYTNVYQATTSSATMFLDVKYTNFNGDYAKLKRMSAVEEVDDNPGSYYTDGTRMYVHTTDSRPADDLILRFTGDHQLRIKGNAIVYLEGVQIIEGRAPVDVEGNSEGIPRFYAKNCKFSYSAYQDNNVASFKNSLSILQDCTASKSRSDGFHYSSSAKGIEIYCVGRNNGTEGNSSDQGSTIHSHCKIMRIDCINYENHGAGIGDDGVNAESWNLGCIGYGSKAINAGQNSNFMVYDNAKMWLDGCVGYDSNYDVSGGGSAFIRNNNFLSHNTFESRTNIEEY